MTKILKKVQLSTEQSTLKSADPTKGTAENPYSQVEMATLQEEGTWNGGYVEGMGLVPMMSVNSYDGSINRVYVQAGSISETKDLPFDYNQYCSKKPGATVNVSWDEGYTDISEAGIDEYLVKSNVTVFASDYSKGELPFTFDGNNTTVVLKVLAEDRGTASGDWDKIADGQYKIIGTLPFRWVIKGENEEDLVYDKNNHKCYLNGSELTNHIFSITCNSSDNQGSTPSCPIEVTDPSFSNP